MPLYASQYGNISTYLWQPNISKYNYKQLVTKLC